MTTLQSIGFTLAGGSGVAFISFLAFGFAERYQSTNIAPRCTARHPNTIYNPDAEYYPSETGGKKNDKTDPPRKHSQYRGWPAIGWILWTMRLSYDVMLRGVPGTGTRKGGENGRLLNVNLDAIVLFRFHRICLKVTLLATILGIGICLPMYYTSPCFNVDALNKAELSNCTAENNYNLTNFERMTLKNVPSVIKIEMDDSDDKSILERLDLSSVSARLYVLVICTWVLTIYTLRLIKKEWVWMLAIRRVYYLEEDHWEKRRDELESIITDDRVEDDIDEAYAFQNRQKMNGMRKNLAKQNSGLKKGNFKTKRDPWIPHPEQRETIPSIELYSVLIGGLPSLPKEFLDEDDVEAVRQTQKESIDWQLSLASTVFDHCIPNQPGFSSSVAAVTILPDARELASAWRKWYKAAAAQRRLTFIRKIMAEKKHYDIEYYPTEQQNRHNKREDNFEQEQLDFINSDLQDDVYKNVDKLQSFYRRIFGSKDHHDIENVLFNAFDFGPEQSAVYSREFAQGAAACCPNGCCEERLYRKSYDELECLEQDCKDRLEACYMDLQRAQHKALLSNKTKSKPDIPTNGSEKKSNASKQKQEGFHLLETPNKKNTTSGQSGVPSKDGDKYPNKLETELNLLDKLTKSPSGPLTTKPDYIQKKGLRKPGHQIKTPALRSTGESNTSAATLQMGAPDTFNEATETSRPSTLKTTQMDVENPFVNDSYDSYDDSYPLPISMILDQKPVNGTQTNQIRTSHNHKNDLSNDNQKATVNATNPQHSIPTSPANSQRQTVHFMNQNSVANLNQSFALTTNGTFRFNNLPIDDLSSIADSNTLPSPVHMPNFTAKPSDGYAEDGSLLGSVHNHIPGSPIAGRPRLSTDPSVCRRRLNSDASFYSRPRSEHSEQRKKFESIINHHRYSTMQDTTSMDINSGALGSVVEHIVAWFRRYFALVKSWCFRTTKNTVDELARESTFAVITFTSRQSAVAARRCLADARGDHRWAAVDYLPIPPLADAASMDFRTCRGCCRPVTMSLNKRQQFIRKAIANIFLAIMFVGYSIPITLTAQLATIEKLTDIWPELKAFVEKYPRSQRLLTGLVPALLFTVFFALCPIIFRAIANSGSNAVSVNRAEYCALKYYWWFMLFTAFAGTAIGSMLFGVLESQQKLETESFQRVILDVANTLPSTVAANWLNWIIIRTTVTLPLQYMLQLNTFVFQLFGLKCCRRIALGGGPGGHIPYRIYIDSGVVFLCVVALSPSCPLIAPAALLYYMYCMPLWRRNCIFIYRPQFDTGGIRWPFLSDVCITSMLVGQIFLVIMLALKEAFGAALCAAISVFIIAYFRVEFRNRYLKAFMDVSLLQTSLLDGWDYTQPLTYEERDTFRRFLVDAHKAAYVPICIAGDQTKILTAEPAVTVPLEGEVDVLSAVVAPEQVSTGANGQIPSPGSSIAPSSTQSHKLPSRGLQHGASLRRISQLHGPNSSVRLMEFHEDDETVNSMGFHSFKSMNLM